MINLATDAVARVNKRPARRLTSRIRSATAWLLSPRAPAALPHFLRWRLQGLLRRLPAPVRIFASQTPATGKPVLLLITNELNRSGAPQVLADLATIATDWFDIVVVSPFDGAWRDPFLEMGATVILSQDIFRDGSDLLVELAAISDLAIGNTVATAQAVITLTSRVPTIWYIHEALGVAAFLSSSTMHQRAAATCAAVWAVSQVGRDEIGRYRADARINCYGCNAPLPGLCVGAATPIRIGVFGSVEHRKGQDLLVEAVKLLPQHIAGQIRITCYGRVMEPDFFTRIQAAGVPAIMSFEAPLGADTYFTAISGCDVVLNSARDDAMPVTVSEGLGAERIVICTERCGQARFLRNGYDSFVAPSPDPKDLAAIIVTAVERRGEWPDIARRGRATFDANFSLASFRERLIREFERFGVATSAPPDCARARGTGTTSLDEDQILAGDKQLATGTE